jgi:predicted ribosome quality control (RQC) complex YloA/Tae2 family protein
MHFDALTLACIATELNCTLCPGRIQQVLLVDAHAIGFEVYTPGVRHQLLLALHSGTARVHTVSYKLRRGVERESPLLLLLRKYARGALISAIEQPDPTERSLRCTLEHPEHGVTTLIIELIGRQPNAILLGAEGRILECLHRLPAGESGRSVLPGRLYTSPPALEKLSPIDDGSDGYYTQLAEVVAQPGPLWKALVAGIAGLSPTAAREVAWRAQMVSATNQREPTVTVLAIAQALQEVWAPLRSGAWQPGLIEEDGALIGFAAYPIHYRGRFVNEPSMSAALERFYAEGAVAQAPDAYAALRGQVLASVKRAQGRLERSLAALEGDEPAPGAAENLRAQANWLLALATQIEPGQAAIEVELGDGHLRIPLDPHLSPVEQAQRMFKRAAKLARAADVIPQRRAELHADCALLEQLFLDAQRATSQPELAAVLDELRRAGLLRATKRGAPQPKRSEGGPLRFRTARGAEIVVGRNARQNEQVTFKFARPADLWLHVRGAAGSHVVVRVPAQAVDEEDVRAAAQLAAYHSSVRGERMVDVIVTERRWVSHAPGGRTGQVLVAKERVVRVAAEMPGEIEEIGQA